MFKEIPLDIFKAQQLLKENKKKGRIELDFSKLSNREIELLFRGLKRPSDTKIYRRGLFHFVTKEKNGYVILFDGLDRVKGKFKIIETKDLSEKEVEEKKIEQERRIREFALSMFLKSSQERGFLYN